MSRRTGIALLTALALLTLLGLLIAGAVASTTIAQRASRLSLSDGVLTASADYAVGSVLGDPIGYALADLPFVQPRMLDVGIPGTNGVRATVAVTRLPAGLLWIVAEATLSGVDEGRRRINLVARFPSPGALPPAGIVARGTVSLAPDVVTSADSTGDADCAVTGAPSVAQRDDSTAFYLTARQMALLDTAPGVRRVRGDTTINGGMFTGILLVDGALTVSGPFTVTGVIVARGLIRSAGGLRVTGALLAYAANSAANSAAIDLAGATVRYSPCTVARTFRAALPPKVVRQRGWAELF